MSATHSSAFSSAIERIHKQALEASARYTRSVADLVDILSLAEKHRVFVKRGHGSLFAYVTGDLGLSEDVACNLIAVARKTREVPELGAYLQAGRVTLTNARRVAAVLTRENQGEWLEKAATLSSRALEKEIVRVRPQEATREHVSYATVDRIRLEMGLFERDLLKLRRAQDLVSQSLGRPASLEDTVVALTREFLRRMDPVEKAKRHRVRKGSEGGGDAEPLGSSGAEGDGVYPSRDGGTAQAPPVPPTAAVSVARRKPGPQREAIPAEVLHAVNWRDQRRCTEILPNGRRCNQSRWTEVHHRIQVHEGGENTVENLTTLCSVHHREVHAR
jgi:hypothetical protein